VVVVTVILWNTATELRDVPILTTVGALPVNVLCLGVAVRCGVSATVAACTGHRVRHVFFRLTAIRRDVSILGAVEASNCRIVLPFPIIVISGDAFRPSPLIFPGGHFQAFSLLMSE
jgi:hypothetical protein